jgi:hypothetical protein
MKIAQKHLKKGKLSSQGLFENRENVLRTSILAHDNNDGKIFGTVENM